MEVHPHDLDREQWWLLAWARELGGIALCEQVRAWGAVHVFEVLAGTRAAGDSRPLARLRRLVAAQAAGAIPQDVVLACDEDFPERLLHVDPPVVGMRVRGDRTLLRAGARLGVVGARRMRADAAAVARMFSSTAAAAGAGIVSGLAIGIDAVAHKAALDAGSFTIAVLGCGIEKVYPASNRDLRARILDEGSLLVSEYGMAADAFPHWFPERNRIIAALSDYVLLVQAGRRSGALHTVDHALALGIQVGVVPGVPGDDYWSTSNRLLAGGAQLVVDSDVILDELGLQAAPPIDLPPELVKALSSAGSVDEIALATGRSASDVMGMLALAAAQGLVRRRADGLWTLAA